MTTVNIKKRATSSMLWAAIQKYTHIGIGLLSGIILARLLEPEDYGCIGMLNIFMAIAEIFIDAGFGSALIQKKKTTQSDYSTVFFFNIVMSGIMYLILFLCAPYIARFYGLPILMNILRVQGLILFIYALNIIQLTQLKKQLNFKIIAIASIIASVTSLIITIYLAYNKYGVWALVAQNFITAFIPMIIFWFSAKWKPSWIFSRNSFKELFSFGGYMFLSSFMNKITGQLSGLLIGRIYNPATMGYYSKAHSTETLASTSISSIISQVTYPLYAAKQENKEELANIIRRITMVISFLTTPLMILLCLIAEPLFIILFSEKWLPSVPYFQLLCLAGIAVCLQSVNNQALAAIGKSKIMFYWTIVKKIVEISLIVIGIIMGGVNGLLIAMIFDNWFIYFVNAYNVSKYIGYSIKKQIFSIIPILIATFASWLVSYYCSSLFHLSVYYDGLIKAVIFLFTYLSWVLLKKPDAYLYFVEIVKKNIIKTK